MIDYFYVNFYYFGCLRDNGQHVKFVPKTARISARKEAKPVKTSSPGFLRVEINPEFDGVEVYFPSKPSETTRDALKSAGYRWHSKKKCWYAKSTEKNLQALGSPSDSAEIDCRVYLVDPAQLATAKDISYRDTRTAEEIAFLEDVLQALRDYRKDLAARYGALDTMAYTRALKLERIPHWKGNIEYIVTITRHYSGKTNVQELRESFPGKERKKAFDRYNVLLKKYPGIHNEMDIEKRSWEK